MTSHDVTAQDFASVRISKPLTLSTAEALDSSRRATAFLEALQSREAD
jgi:hypothetical protein